MRSIRVTSRTSPEAGGMETSADIFAVWNAAAACGCGCLYRCTRLDCNGLTRGRLQLVVILQKACHSSASTFGSSRRAGAIVYCFDAHRRLVPYNASNQASRARPRHLHEPGAGSAAPEASRRHAARARPRLVSNNALSQLGPAKPQGGTVVHAGSPCDAICGLRATARIGNQEATPPRSKALPAATPGRFLLRASAA